MKILYFRHGGQLWPGIITNNGVIDVRKFSDHYGSRQYDDQPLTMEDLAVFRKIEQNSLQHPGVLIDEHTLVAGPCVPRPGKIICIGLNYRKHALESGMDIPTVPVAFTKYNNTLTDYSSDVRLGEEGLHFDYEVELGIVMGRKCKGVSKQEALNYVLGYCVANDLSCRDLQFKTSQWLLGKSLDQFLPLGKCLVTADEVGDPQNLQLRCTVNGELRQNSNTGDMIFPVAEIIEFVSRYMTLEPGDLILSGTPEGVIMGMAEKNWLVPGDRVKVEIEKLGYSENFMA
jgi:2-keto-4-pentenoate hydratase/2-oxohepta-3-ene-1,7-dioic acid hydratase in catechol pathway